ncbi:MAG: PIN/TRAM domain-containing protein, partial [Terriglobales bacterium]
GIFGAYLISLILHAAGLRAVIAGDASLLALAVMTYIGLIVGAEKGDFLNLAALGGLFAPDRLRRGGKLLDTSAIIDGRLADIAETGFLEGPLWVPHFVLRELQTIADSADGSKRQRGRRGLDVLQRLQHIPGLDVRMLEEEPIRAREVDHQLVETARLHDSKIVTNDFNLNKLAQLQNVAVLNVNELANAVKTVVLAGESLRVHITKEGKEAGQGVGYLEDGTLVVVEHGRRLISRCADVVVTSVLQTPAGKMVFARASDERAEYRPARAAEAGGPAAN